MANGVDPDQTTPLGVLSHLYSQYLGFLYRVVVLQARGLLGCFSTRTHSHNFKHC